MVGIYASGLLPSLIVRPCIYVGANDSGAGKGTLCKLITSSVHGSIASSPYQGEEELRKFLLSCVREGQQVIMLDNLKGTLDSAVLQQFLTAVTLNGRLLRQNTTFQGEVNSTVFMTGNRCKLSPDTYRRTLSIFLRMKDSLFSNRTFTPNEDRPDGRLNDAALVELRPKLLAALWAIVKNWDATGRPFSQTVNYSYPEWSELIGGIVEAAGFGNVALNLKTVDVDEDYINVETLVAGMVSVGDTLFTVNDLLKISLQVGAFEDIVNEESFGRLRYWSHKKLVESLSRFAGRPVLERYLYVYGRGNNRRYFLHDTPLPNDMIHKVGGQKK